MTNELTELVLLEMTLIDRKRRVQSRIADLQTLLGVIERRLERIPHEKFMAAQRKRSA